MLGASGFLGAAAMAKANKEIEDMIVDDDYKKSLESLIKLQTKHNEEMVEMLAKMLSEKKNG